MFPAQINIPDEVLTAAVAQSLSTGELGRQVAAELAILCAEVTTYNKTEAAELLNIGRTKLYEYEADGLIRFDSDGRISLAALRELRRKLAESGAEAGADSGDAGGKDVNRKSHKTKRRSLK